MDKKLYNIINRKYEITEEGLAALTQNYNLGYSQQKIAKKFKVSEDVIRRWMKENNIPTRTRKYAIDENYFSIIDTSEKAYWLGFLAADGYIHNSRGELQLELQEADKEHLEKFMKSVNTNKPLMKIYCGENKQFLHFRFVIRCRKMVEDLKKYNIIQRKSLTFYPVNIPKNLFGYWILGYMDGDGCIYKAKNRIKISFTGTQKTLNIIKKYFNSSNLISKEHRCQNTYKFTLEVDKSEKFLNDINYKDLSFVLDRKKQRYCLFIQ